MDIIVNKIELSQIKVDPFKIITDKIDKLGYCVFEEDILKLTSLSKTKLTQFIKKKGLDSRYFKIINNKHVFTSDGARLLLILLDYKYLDLYLSLCKDENISR
jgi:hypothetical protein